MNARVCVTALLCAQFAGCHPASSSRTDRTRLVIAEQREPPSLNTIFFEGPSATLNPLIYSYLLEYDQHGNLVPDLASAVPSRANGGISSDGLTVTYHLRRNAKWQDGAPVTAADVAFTYRAIMDRRNNVMSRYGFDRVQRITTPDLYTVRIRLRAPYSPITSVFFAPDSNYGILPEHLLRRYAGLNQVPFNAKPVGSGPYRVVAWKRGESIELVRNPLYFRGTPAIESISLKFVANSNAILNQLRTGEANAYLFADAEHLPDYRSIKSLQVVRAPFAGYGDLFFNTSDTAVADPAVRRAIVQAIDIPTVVRNATRDTQSPVDAGRGLFSWAYDPSVTSPRYDPSRAKRVLRARGVRSLSFAYESGIATSGALAVQLQRQLAAAGVDVTLHPYTPQMFRAPAADGGPLWSGKFQLAFIEWYTTVDPNTQWVFSCAQIPPNGLNAERFCNPNVEAAEEADLRTYDRSERRRLASIVQRRIAQQVPEVPLWSANAIYVVPANLRGFRPSPTSPYWNAGEWSL